MRIVTSSILLFFFCWPCIQGLPSNSLFPPNSTGPFSCSQNSDCCLQEVCFRGICYLCESHPGNSCSDKPCCRGFSCISNLCISNSLKAPTSFPTTSPTKCLNSSSVPFPTTSPSLSPHFFSSK